MTGEERRQKVESYGRAYDELAAALKEFPREMWQFKPAPDRWSVHEIIIHLADSEANSYVRARRLIAEPGQAVMAYDQDLWAQKLNYHAQSTEEALELFRWLRQTSYNLIRALPESAWSHTASHPEYGSYSFERWLDIYEQHTRGHIRQMRNNLEAWRAQRAATA
jgi:hypothetical protein